MPSSKISRREEVGNGGVKKNKNYASPNSKPHCKVGAAVLFLALLVLGTWSGYALLGLKEDKSERNNVIDDMDSIRFLFGSTNVHLVVDGQSGLFYDFVSFHKLVADAISYTGAIILLF